MARFSRRSTFELGIAENNLFLALGAAGLSNKIFGSSLIPIGTIYDTFISRGLLRKLCSLSRR